VTIELRPASTFSLEELAALFNAGYEGYFVPFRIDADALRAMNEAFDIDRDASRVALLDDEPVGLANLAVRAAESWVGGVGVVVSARRRGIAERLMHSLHDEARSRGVETVWLEVIEQNEAAYRLYDKLGYDVVREVEVWTLPADESGGSAAEVAANEAHARVRELRTSREPWQRADATLEHYDDLLGLQTGGGAAVFRTGAAVQLLQIAGEAMTELLRTMRTRGTVSALNVPVDDPAAEAFRDLGATVAVRQREMMLTL
jgi:ribosomal protein S18 acetylase RimI-like enzyme